MYLVLAFFMWLAFMARVGSDKASLASSNKDTYEWIQSMKDSYRWFLEKYSDDECEELCMRNCRYGLYDKKSCDDIREEIKREVGIDPTTDMVIMGMMAYYGRIPKRLIRGGISPPVRYGMSKMQFQEYRRQYVRFLKWYNQKLREHGVDDDLLHIEDNGHSLAECIHNRSLCRPITEVSDDSFGEVYFWWDARIYVTRFGEII